MPNHIKILIDQHTTKHNFDDAVTSRDLFKGMFFENEQVDVNMETYDSNYVTKLVGNRQEVNHTKYIVYGELANIRNLKYTLFLDYLKVYTGHEPAHSTVYFMQKKHAHFIPDICEATNNSPVIHLLENDADLDEIFMDIFIATHAKTIVDFTGKASLYFNTKTVIDAPNNLIKHAGGLSQRLLSHRYIKLPGYMSLEDVEDLKAEEQEMIDECTHDTDCHSCYEPVHDRFSE